MASSKSIASHHQPPIALADVFESFESVARGGMAADTHRGTTDKHPEGGWHHDQMLYRKKAGATAMMAVRDVPGGTSLELGGTPQEFGYRATFIHSAPMGAVSYSARETRGGPAVVRVERRGYQFTSDNPDLARRIALMSARKLRFAASRRRGLQN